MNQTIVINVVGGSGLGKSTTAAAVFAELKLRGSHCELVREAIKEWAWEGKRIGPFGQSIIYGKQLERESSLYGKVDLIITDSALMMCPIYQQFYEGHDTIKHCVFKDLETANKMKVTHLNFLLRRHKKFDTRGRYETEDTAKLMDQKTESFLVYHNIPYIAVDCDGHDRVKFIADKTMELFNANIVPDQV